MVTADQQPDTTAGAGWRPAGAIPETVEQQSAVLARAFGHKEKEKVPR